MGDLTQSGGNCIRLLKSTAPADKHFARAASLQRALEQLYSSHTNELTMTREIVKRGITKSAPELLYDVVPATIESAILIHPASDSFSKGVEPRLT